MKNIKILVLVLCVAFCFCLTGCFEGDSAYDIAVDNGFTGTEEEWLASLKGDKGEDGTDASELTIDEIYSSAVSAGYTGTKLEFLSEYVSTLAEEIAINEALLSSVAILCNFTCTYTTGGFWGSRPGSTQTYQASSAGSGVIYDVDKTNGNAYIITNYHVVYESSCNTSNKISDEITVYLYGMLYDSQGIKATYVGGSMNYDLAVLYIENSELIKNSSVQEITFGDSDNLVVGQKSIAVGNPENEGISVTSGIVSVSSEYISMTAADNVTAVTFRVIRTDTAVNSGNSGGGLFNANGQLIGIVNAKIADEDIENISYAIPSNIVKVVVEQIINNSDHTVKRLYLGIIYQTNSASITYDENKDVISIDEVVIVKSLNTENNVTNVLQADDEIVKVKLNDTEFVITKDYVLGDLFLQCKENDVLVFTLLRDGTEVTATLTITSSMIQAIA